MFRGSLPTAETHHVLKRVAVNIKEADDCCELRYTVAICAAYGIGVNPLV